MEVEIQHVLHLVTTQSGSASPRTLSSNPRLHSVKKELSQRELDFGAASPGLRNSSGSIGSPGDNSRSRSPPGNTSSSTSDRDGRNMQTDDGSLEDVEGVQTFEECANPFQGLDARTLSVNAMLSALLLKGVYQEIQIVPTWFTDNRTRYEKKKQNMRSFPNSSI